MKFKNPFKKEQIYYQVEFSYEDFGIPYIKNPSKNNQFDGLSCHPDTKEYKQSIKKLYDLLLKIPFGSYFIPFD